LRIHHIEFLLRRNVLWVIGVNNRSQSIQNTEHLAKYSLQALNDVVNTCTNEGAAVALNEAVSKELEKIQKAVNETIAFSADRRLDHLLIYVLVVHPNVPSILLKINLWEQFASAPLKEENSHVDAMQKLAESNLKKIRESPQFQQKMFDKLYTQLLDDYNEFRRLITYFVVGFERYQTGRYELSLPYLLKACELNNLLIRKYDRHLSGLNPKIALMYRRQCLLHLNNEALCQFDSEDTGTALDGLQMMNSFVVPCMNLLSAEDALVEDNEAAEEIRASWCTKLGEEIISSKQEHLPELLSKLLDPPSDQEISWKTPLQIARFSDSELKQRYQIVAKQMHDSIALNEKR